MPNREELMATRRSAMGSWKTSARHSNVVYEEAVRIWTPTQ